MISINELRAGNLIKTTYSNKIFDPFSGCLSVENIKTLKSNS